MSHQDRLNIAVFIDFDNIEIGVKSTLGEHFDVGTILDAIKERGEVVTKIAYADWTRAGEYSRTLTQHAIRLVQRNLTPGGDKNGADINLALDALEMAFTHPHINAYVIVGGDSDFLSLVEKLKQYDKKVFVVGGRAFTSIILQRNCHEFIAYENLTGGRRSVAKGERPAPATAATPIVQAFPIVRRGLKILSEREVSPQIGLLKSTLLQLDSTFSERNYGASSFLDFVEKLAQAGLVQLKHAGRSVMVELNSAFDETATAGPRIGTTTDGEGDAVTTQAPPPASGFGEARRGDSAGGGPRPGGEQAPQGPPPPQIGDSATGVRLVGDILKRATTARWPMYLRNVKQILRAAGAEAGATDAGTGGFDERRYGFGGLMDLLRACQREGFIRLERDRRGGLRVFQGPALQRPATLTEEPIDIDEAAERQPIELAIEPGQSLDAQEAAEMEQAEAGHIPIDTTAELLGRAKPRRPRARAPIAAPRSLKPAGARKTAARRTPRPKKSAS